MKLSEADKNLNLAVDLLYKNMEAIRQIAYKTASELPGERHEYVIICASVNEPWLDLIEDLDSQSIARANAIR
jgi:hypothetical protein